MITQFKRTLSKQITNIKASLTEKEAHSRQDIINLLSEMQTNLEGSFETLSDSNDKKVSESKNLLKKTNKSFTEYKMLSEKKQLETAKENEELRRQLQRSKRKVHELLKHSQRHELNLRKKQEKRNFEKGTQCNMRDDEMERILEEREKQNILLKQRIAELQKQANEGKQDVEAANILIKELVKQLETNIADRETWNGTGSSNASQLDSLDRLDDSDESLGSGPEGILSEREQQISEASVCRGGGAAQDCSTIDGSNTTNKDYALPEWLQFGESTPKVNHLDKLEEEEVKMWPELLWNRFRQFIGRSYEL